MSLLHFKDGEMRASDTYVPLADYFELSNRARLITRGEYYGGDHPQSAWHIRVQYGRRELKKAGYLDLDVPSGTWRLNEVGRSVASDICDDYYGLHPTHNLTRSQELGAQNATPEASDVADPTDAERVKCTTYRVLRDTEIARRVKAIHNYQCQVCGSGPLKLPGGLNYAEAHHIIPLSQRGPDSEENILCVCPNCHVLLDYNAIELDLSQLLHQSRRISSASIAYHNDQFKIAQHLSE